MSTIRIDNPDTFPPDQRVLYTNLNTFIKAFEQIQKENTMRNLITWKSFAQVEEDIFEIILATSDIPMFGCESTQKTESLLLCQQTFDSRANLEKILSIKADDLLNEY